MVPYTLVAIGPTNTELIVLSRDDTLRDRGDADAERVDALLQTWERRHLVRYAAFMGAWALALAALVLDNRA